LRDEVAAEDEPELGRLRLLQELGNGAANVRGLLRRARRSGTDNNVNNDGDHDGQTNAGFRYHDGMSQLLKRQPAKGKRAKAEGKTQ
jgi:hypothetical protein